MGSTQLAVFISFPIPLSFHQMFLITLYSSLSYLTCDPASLSVSLRFLLKSLLYLYGHFLFSRLLQRNHRMAQGKKTPNMLQLSHLLPFTQRPRSFSPKGGHMTWDHIFTPLPQPAIPFPLFLVINTHTWSTAYRSKYKIINIIYKICHLYEKSSFIQYSNQLDICNH